MDYMKLLVAVLSLGLMSSVAVSAYENVMIEPPVGPSVGQLVAEQNKIESQINELTQKIAEHLEQNDGVAQISFYTAVSRQIAKLTSDFDSLALRIAYKKLDQVRATMKLRSSIGRDAYEQLVIEEAALVREIKELSSRFTWN
jgi:predicted nucleotidyltransferase